MAISVQEATEIILSHTTSYGVQSVPLTKATGYVLAENILADRDFPPYDRVAMDGIAILHEAFSNGVLEFPIAGTQAAGAPPEQLQNAEHCLEVMTGAILPEGTDTVIRYEDLRIENQRARLEITQIKKGKNIHNKGIDRKQGDQIIGSGTLISPAEISVAATVGKEALQVANVPKTVILYTGDEIVDVGEMPLPYQIRCSNAYVFSSLLLPLGITPTLVHLPDNMVGIQEALAQYTQEYDLLLLSGGISKGKFDFVPEAMKKTGMIKLIEGIRQRPGKPFWFGKNAEGVVAFAFPGNPVSSFLNARRYLMPWLRACLGMEAFSIVYASLEEEVVFEKRLTRFLPVKIRYDNHRMLLAQPIATQGSGDLASLVNADGFMELPEEKNTFGKNELYPIFLYR